MITEAYIVKIIAVLMGCWASGYGVGKAVAWVRALGTAS